MALTARRPDPAGDTAVRRGGYLLLTAALLGLCLSALEHKAGPSLHTGGAPETTHAATAASPPVEGLATFYADDFQGGVMADGGRFDMNDASVTAANDWPLGTRLEVSRVPGGPWDATLTPAERARFFSRRLVVTVRDRGNFTHPLDLSRAAFAQLGRPSEGVIRVQIRPLPPDTR